MKTHARWRLVLVAVFAVVACGVACLAVYFRIEDRRLRIQLHNLFADGYGGQQRQVIAPIIRPKPSAILDAPIDEQTALRFYWFGDMDSHFRNPVDFYVVSATDHRLHSVDCAWPEAAKSFITAAEMKNMIDVLKSLGLRWDDSGNREEFKDWRHRTDDGFLDIDFITRDSTTKSHIRVAEMCANLTKFDSKMPTPRILWQFRTFRWDNGCDVPEYENREVPPE